jgi:hypothetical protein
MKRKKVEDMDAFERARWDLQRARRSSARQLRLLSGVSAENLDAATRAKLPGLLKYWQSIHVLTKPSWVAKAGRQELVQMLRHIAQKSN